MGERRQRQGDCIAIGRADAQPWPLARSRRAAGRGERSAAELPKKTGLTTLFVATIGRVSSMARKGRISRLLNDLAAPERG
jgi:hypothetical protein